MEIQQVQLQTFILEIIVLRLLLQMDVMILSVQTYQILRKLLLSFIASRLKQILIVQTLLLQISRLILLLGFGILE